MSEVETDALLRWVRELPAVELLELAQAVRSGPSSLAAFKAGSSHSRVLMACGDLKESVAAGHGGYIAGILEGALAQQRSASDETIDVVWTGPTSSVTTSRLTSAVIAGLLEEARHEILLVSYASYPPQSVIDALLAASARGVQVTLLAERPADRPGFHGVDLPMPGVTCKRLHWPASAREAGASLHAKVLVIDSAIVLVGSANFTGHAMERNLECGLLVRGGPLPTEIREHLLTLKDISAVRS
jgi:cardiolipin synthase